VTVVEMGATEEVAQIAHEQGAAHLGLHPDTIYARAINDGIAKTGGDAVLILNSDCFLEPGFLATARARLAEDGVGSVAPRLIRTRGPDPAERLDAIDAAGMVVDRRRKNTLVGHGRPSLAYDTAGEAFGPDGAAALYRRETLEDCAVEGQVFDEDLELWASDVDLAWRARLLGWRCAYEPRAVAYHVRSYSPSTRGRMPEAARRLQFRNRYLMIAKNDTAGDLVRDMHRLLGFEVAALAFAALREPFLFAGYREAARLLPGALRKRAEIQRRRRERGVASVPLGLEPRP
jgi:GT2 family glycosyltransferase